MYTRLVVPLDGSENAETAIVEAEHMASLIYAPIHLVRVVEFSAQDVGATYGMTADPAAMTMLLADETESARQYLESTARRIDDQRFQVSHEILRGPVPNQLIAAARPGDLFVMASHGRSGIARWFLGSVAEEVIRRSMVPVLLVKTSSFGRRASNRSLVGATGGILSSKALSKLSPQN